MSRFQEFLNKPVAFDRTPDSAASITPSAKKASRGHHPRAIYKSDKNTLQVQIKGGKYYDSQVLEIPDFELTPKALVNHSVVLYGTTGAGKTAIIMDIMYTLRHEFPRVVVFSPTDAQHGDFSSVVPRALVYHDIDDGIIKRLYESQEAATTVYKLVHSLKALEPLACRVMTPEQRNRAQEIRKQAAALMQTSNSVEQVDVEKDLDTRLVKLYRDVLTEQRPKLLRMRHDMSAQEIMIMKYLNYNPNLLIVFDDTQTEVMNLLKSKKDGDILRNFFNRGRHVNITHIYSFQDDAHLDSGLKKNTHYSIFASHPAATSYFTRPSTSISDLEKAHARAAAAEIFKHYHDESQGIELAHRKLVYSKQHGMMKLTATKHGRFQMCSPAVREYCECIEKDECAMLNSAEMQRFSGSRR